MRALALLLAVALAAGAAQAQTLADFWAGSAYFERQSYTTPYDPSCPGGHCWPVHEVAPIQVGANTIYMYYRTYVGQPSDGGAIGLAISTDGGASFTLYNGGAPVVAPGPGSCDLDSQYAISPGVVKVGTTFYMVYEGRSKGQPFCGSPGDIMLATSADGLTWIKQGRIITHGGGFESSNIGTPFIGWFNNKFYVFYHGFDGTRSKVGYASGTNIYALTKGPNPVMDIGKGKYSWDSYVNSHVSIVQEGSTYYMVYEGSQSPWCSGGSWGWGVARSTDLNSWEKFAYNPVRHTYAGGCGNDLPALFKFNGATYVYQREAGQRSILRTGADPYLTVWQAESRCSTYHRIGRLDGNGWSANTAADGAGHLCYGPYVQFPAGNYDVTLVEQEDVNSGWNDKVTTQDVYDSTSGSVVKSRDIYRNDFAQNWLYQGFNTQFPASAGHAYEFRTYWFDKAYIRQDLAFARRL